MKKNLLIIAIGVVLSTIIVYQINRPDEVKQVVTEGLYENLGLVNDSVLMTLMDGNTVKHYFTSYESNLKPYKLVTSYKSEDVIDYGTFEEINNIKCKRFNEMKNKGKIIDGLEIAKEKAEEKLKKLNETCK